jgi:hypothetical protein
LDLTGTGTMSVAVDDKPMIQVYDNMKKNKGSRQHFIPKYGSGRPTHGLTIQSAPPLPRLTIMVCDQHSRR